MIDAEITAVYRNKCPILLKSISLSRAVPKQKLCTDAFLYGILVQVMSESYIEDSLTAGNEADDLIITLTTYLCSVDNFTDID